MRAPNNLTPTEANQMSFDQRELHIICHWSITSRMPERYDRSVCANELLLRNTIMNKMRHGWEMAPGFHMPVTAADHQRIGKEEFSGSIPSSLPRLGIGSSRRRRLFATVYRRVPR